MVDIEHQQRKRLVGCDRVLDRHLDRAVEIFAIAKTSEGIGQAFGPYRFQALLEIADFRHRQHQPFFQCLVGVLHLTGRFHQQFDDRFDLVAAFRIGKLFVRPAQAGVIAGRHAERIADQPHHVVDFADHPRTDLVDAVGGLDVGKIGLVDLLEIGLGQLAVARQRLVDDLVERRIVAGGVDVPDFIIAGDGGLPQRFDLAQRKFGKSHRAFMFVEH